MFLDYFQLGLENVKLFESVDRPNTTHKLVSDDVKRDLGISFNNRFSLFSFSSLCLDMNWTLTEQIVFFAAPSLTLLKAIHVLVVAISCGLYFILLSVYGSCFQLFGCIPLIWSGSGSAIRITWIVVDQMNRWILVQSGFIGSFDLPWSEWKIKDSQKILWGRHRYKDFFLFLGAITLIPLKAFHRN